MTPMTAEIEQVLVLQKTNIASEAERELHQRRIHSGYPEQHHDDQMTQNRAAVATVPESTYSVSARTT